MIEELLVELKIRNMPIDEFRMQNLIYKIKMDLGADHPLYDKLAFYWDVDGPYSEVVSEEFKYEMSKLNTSKGQSLLKDKYDNIPLKLINKYPQIQDSLNILENRQYFYNQMDKDSYMEYAPYKFMKIYKYKIYNPIKNTVKLENTYLIYKLYDCEGRLPPEGHFNKYKLIYSTFTTNIDFLNDCGNFDKNWELIESIILKFWDIFSLGLRVLHKDKYYDDKVEKWNHEFENSLDPLKTRVYCLEKYIDYDKLPEIEETEAMRRLHEATLKVYWDDLYGE